ncbi:MAG: hypothetical protein WDN25_09330 [Acetobacteraceae bacterium]
MADQSDVEEALVSIASLALYPNGIGEPSVPGPDCRIYRGWPNSAALDADLAAGKINVTVFQAGTTARTTTRFAEQWMGEPGQPTLIATVSGTSVTFGGTATLGQVAGIMVDGTSYAYRTRPGDTPQMVAASLAAMARDRAIVRLSHGTLSIPGAGILVARVAADADVKQEVRRQEQGFRIICWCPTPASRDAATAAIDEALSGRRTLQLADGTRGVLSYGGTTVFDQSQNARLYRRDLTYSVEYATTVSSRRSSMLFGNLVVNTSPYTA